MQHKTGFLTSEFVLSIVALVTPAIAAAFQGSGNPALAAIGAALAAVYTLSRTVLKNTDLKAPTVEVASDTKSLHLVMPSLPPAESPAPSEPLPPVVAEAAAPKV